MSVQLPHAKASQLQRQSPLNLGFSIGQISQLSHFYHSLLLEQWNNSFDAVKADTSLTTIVKAFCQNDCSWWKALFRKTEINLRTLHIQKTASQNTNCTANDSKWARSKTQDCIQKGNLAQRECCFFLLNPVADRRALHKKNTESNIYHIQHTHTYICILYTLRHCISLYYIS